MTVIPNLPYNLLIRALQRDGWVIVRQKNLIACVIVVLKLQSSMIEIKQTATYRKWQSNLKDQRAKALIAARVFRLANGLAGDVKPVGQGVSELRIHYGPGYRIYYHQRGDEMILLLCGGDKSSQKRNIEAAIELVAQWRQP